MSWMSINDHPRWDRPLKSLETRVTTTEQCKMGEQESEQTGETSHAGLQRMRRLAMEMPVLGDSLAGAFHPTSSNMVYRAPKSSKHQGFLITSVLKSRPPRPLPTPPMLSPASQISISPTGEWIVLFHPNPVGEGGRLGIYPSTILSPVMKPSMVVSHSAVTLDRAPLAILQLYPPKKELDDGQAPRLGPKPPVLWSSLQGPVILVLTSTGLHLVHPVPFARPILPDSPEGNIGWTSGVLKCPLHMRWHAKAGGSAPPEARQLATKGWMGMIPHNDGIWVAVEMGGELRVVRAAVGADQFNGFYLQTSPMPKLSALLPGKRKGQAGTEVVVPSEAMSVETLHNVVKSSSETSSCPDEIQLVSFIPITDDLRSTSSSPTSVTERVGVAVVSRTTPSLQNPDNVTTRIDLSGFEKRPIEVIDSSGELVSTTDSARSWDWCSIPDIISSSVSPRGTNVVAIVALPSLTPHSIILTLILDSNSLKLSRLDLTRSDNNEVARDGRWSALKGPQLPLSGLSVSGPISLVASSGVTRGSLGLVGVIGDKKMTLVIPPLGAADGSTLNTDGLIDMTARGLLSALRGVEDASDIYRAASASVEKSDMPEVANRVLDKMDETGREQHDPKRRQACLRAQIVLSGLYDELLRNSMTDLLRTQAVNDIFASAAVILPADPKAVTFDIGCLNELCAVALWAIVSCSLHIRRKAEVKSMLSWDYDMVQAEPSAWVDHLLHFDSTSRKIAIGVLARVKAFTAFLHHFKDDSSLAVRGERYSMSALSSTARGEIGSSIFGALDQIESAVEDEGLDVDLWGSELVAIEQTVVKEPSIESGLTRDLDARQKISLINGIAPVPECSLILKGNSEPKDYDAITFLPLGSDSAPIMCERCKWRTTALHGLIFGQSGELPGRGTVWEEWLNERKNGCYCGGTWVRAN